MPQRSAGALVLFVVLASATGRGAPQAVRQEPLNALSLFRLYSSGDSVASMQRVAALPEPGLDGLVRDLRRRVGSWVRDAGNTDRARLDAATFLLDVASTRLETDWLAVRELVEIGCRLIEPVSSANDRARRWHLAALALVEGAADARFLFDAARPKEFATFDHLAHSRSKFPEEPRFRLAEAFVPTMGITDLAPPRDQAWRDDEELRAGPAIGRVEVAMRRDRRDKVQELRRFTEVNGVSAEAHLRVGHLEYQLNNDAAALDHLRAALAGTEEPFIEYIAHLLTAMIHTRRGSRAEAEASLGRALDVVPFAQSAVELLSAELFLSGRESQAHDLLESWFERRNKPVDPWRLFGYGDFRTLPDLLGGLRREVGK
jgi:hypothetical protein